MPPAGAYYNEIDPYAAQWLRNLIAAGHIAPGDVDQRSIEDVHPDDLRPYTQCHFFAGIGVWSHALRGAGWADDRPVWTGSCPCQPFSAAGKGAAFDDERHLWPHWHWLIQECRPAIIFGEQVASKDAGSWLDLVQADMEALVYAFGAVPFPAAGIGAPHIRDRLYWVAHAHGARSLPRAHAGVHRGQEGPGPRNGEPERLGATVGLAYTAGAGFERRRAGEARDGRYTARLEPERFRDVVGMAHGDHDGRATAPLDRRHDAEHHAQPCGESGGLAIAQHRGLETRKSERTGPDAALPPGAAGGLADTFLQQRSDGESRIGAEHDPDGRIEGAAAIAGLRRDLRPGPLYGFWRDADWLLCRDGKWRPVEPGTFPLVNGAPSRVGRLRAYGNAIVAPQAQLFIEETMRCIE